MISTTLDIEASLARVGTYVSLDMLKLPEDLDRYAAVIAADKPDLLIECGTAAGDSARWFAGQGLDVITIDISALDFSADDRVTQIAGNSASPAVAAQAADAARGRRVMVSLDSDHSAAHVATEIRLYGPLVSPGCHLVVEDGLIGWFPASMRAAHGNNGDGSPMDAIRELLDGNPEWKRDMTTEQMHPVSLYPAGWWIRRG
ncbi:MAG: hypothetical protein J2P30_00140 [Actinobacteria bacterium]|nr:hypothetical protein [Actinomycetota bacterium]